MQRHSNLDSMTRVMIQTVIWKNVVIADPTHLVKLEQWSEADYNGLPYNFCSNGTSWLASSFIMICQQKRMI